MLLTLCRQLLETGGGGRKREKRGDEGEEEMRGEGEEMRGEKR